MSEERWAAACRLVVDRVAELDPGLPVAVVAEALEVAARTPRALGVLARALDDSPKALLSGAPVVVGRLVHELRARGSVLAEPACGRCQRTGLELIASDAGGLCGRCRQRQLASACARCGIAKPVYGRGAEGEPLCSACAPRPMRRCSRCGRVNVIARRAHDGEGELCGSCFKGPVATCGVCGRHRPSRNVLAPPALEHRFEQCRFGMKRHRRVDEHQRRCPMGLRHHTLRPAGHLLPRSGTRCNVTRCRSVASALGPVVDGSMNWAFDAASARRRQNSSAPWTRWSWSPVIAHRVE